MIEITVTVNLKDTMIIIWASLTRSLPLLLLNLVFPLAGIILLCFEFFFGDSANMLIVVSAALLAIFFTPLISIVTYYFLKIKNPAAFQQTYQIDETGITQLGKDVTLDIHWEIFEKITETKSYFLTFQKMKAGSVGAIPKRALSDNNITELRELFARKVK